MSPDVLAAFIAFVIVMSVTPGPNNMMVLASGVNFGFWRTMPHMLGIAVGSATMVLIVGIGFGQAFGAHPAVHSALQALGTAYMLWLAWKIGRSGPIRGQAAGASGRPLTFLQAAAFQWVNPKAWVLSVGAVSTYIDPVRPVSGGLLAASVFALVAVPSVAVWAAFGSALRRVLADARRVNAFNYAMATALVASLLPTLASFAQIR